MEFVKSFNRAWLVVIEHSSSFFLQNKVEFHDLLDYKNLALFVQDFRC